MQICDRCGGLTMDLIRAIVVHPTAAIARWRTTRITVHQGVARTEVFLCLDCFDPLVPDATLRSILETAPDTAFA